MLNRIMKYTIMKKITIVVHRMSPRLTSASSVVALYFTLGGIPRHRKGPPS